MTRYCPECGTQVAPGARFCVSCGSAVPEIDPTPTPPDLPGHDVDEPTAPFRPDPEPVARPEAEATARPEAEATARPDAEATAPFRPEPEPARPDPESIARPPVVGGQVGSYPQVRRASSVEDQFTAWPDEVGQGPDPWAGAPVGQPTPEAAPSIPPSTPPVPALLPYEVAPQDTVRRSSWPWAVLALAVVAALVVAYLVLNGRTQPPVTTATSGSTSVAGPTSQGTTSPTPTPSVPVAKVVAAQEAVKAILAPGKGSVATLNAGIKAFCGGDKEAGKKQIKDALVGRTAQLDQIGRTPEELFAAIPNGSQARAQLKAALEASADVDSAYLRFAGEDRICPDNAELAAGNVKASEAKKAFLATWNPILIAAKLPAMVATDL